MNNYTARWQWLALGVLAAACAPTQPRDLLHDAGTVDLGEWADYGDPVVVARLAGYARAAAGETADLDGDGIPDIVVLTDPDGTRHWLGQQGYNAPASWDWTLRPDGTELIHLEYDANGFAAQVVERSPGRVVETTDTDGNGKYDARRTLTWAEGAVTIDVVNEADPTEQQAWQQVSHETQSRYPTQGQDLGCEPAFWDTHIDQRPGPPIRLLLGDQKYSCAAHQDAVQKALSCALRRATNCLSRLRPRMYQSLDKRFLEHLPVMVGCAKPCPGAWGQSEEFGARLLLYEDVLNDPEQACQTALHELLHIIGARQGRNHSSGAHSSDDLVFACAGACGTRACSEFVDDCTKCASSADIARYLCGSNYVVDANATCPNQDVCHGGIGVNKHCQVCQATLEKGCDDVTLFSTDTCCAQCPTDANASNDYPCSGTPPPPSTCGTPDSPLCKRVPFGADLNP